MVSDPVADMLARLRNAYMARQDRTEIPMSKLKVHIATVLQQEGYISEYRVDTAFPGKLTLFLKYGRDRRGAIVGLRRRSRPGRREYIGFDGIAPVHNGMGISILSTSRGVMSDRDARKNGVGGEVLCEVW